MRRLLSLVACVLLTGTLAGVTGMPAQARGHALVCDGTYVNQTFKDVVVPDGARCVIKDSVITGNVRTEGSGSPRTVLLIGTSVGHNIHLRNVTHAVTIGSAACRLDPHVANNVMVRNSHNVAVCRMAIDNNLVLSDNTGRMVARGNVVCNNIRVVRNQLTGLSVVGNDHAIHLDVSRNAVQRTSRIRANTQLTGTPASCRRMVRTIG
jgi:hypothetical protein